MSKVPPPISNQPASTAVNRRTQSDPEVPFRPRPGGPQGREGTQSRGVPLKEGTAAKGVPLREGTAAKGVPLREGTAAKGVPLREGTAAKGAPLREGTNAKGAPLQREGTQSAGTPLREGTAAKGTPLREGTQNKGVPLQALPRPPLPLSRPPQRSEQKKASTEHKDPEASAVSYLHAEDSDVTQTGHQKKSLKQMWQERTGKRGAVQRGAGGAAGGQETTSAPLEVPPDPFAPTKTPKLADAFVQKALAVAAKLREKDKKEAPFRRQHPPGSPMEALQHAEEAGVYFQEQYREDGRGEESEDPELAAAVEEAIRLLFGVRGIHRIAPGLNQAGDPVVLIHVVTGFSEASMAKVPPRVHRFPTLVALPFDLLPLRRDRPA